MSGSHVLLEVIATTVADARLAAQAGADRLELITGMGEGGLTPSLGLIEAVTAAVDIPVNVIVRPHSRSFVFDGDDFAVMLRDVRAVAAAGANGVVIGMLTPDGEIDRVEPEQYIERLMQIAGFIERTVERDRKTIRRVDRPR
jgi:copper homeostasis protein